MRGHEIALLQPLLDYLAARNDLRLIGPRNAAGRAPTVAVALNRPALPVASALGEHANPAFRLAFAADDSHVVYGCNHFDLLARDEVADRLLTWCGEVKNRVR